MHFQVNRFPCSNNAVRKLECNRPFEVERPWSYFSPSKIDPFGGPAYKQRLPNNMYYIMDELITKNPMDEDLVDKLTNYGCWCQLQIPNDAPTGIFSLLKDLT